MGLGLGTILYVALLLINAIAVLNEERFLARIGWSSLQPAQQFNAQYDNTGFGDQGGPGVKSRLINLISAVRTLLRIPLIVVNIVVILYELVLG
ncbi:Yos1-like protein [Ceratobasidium sp. AG-I]|nr:Yos1-like protein [Ceratobasidium sp. AG-I]